MRKKIKTKIIKDIMEVSDTGGITVFIPSESFKKRKNETIDLSVHKNLTLKRSTSERMNNIPKSIIYSMSSVVDFFLDDFMKSLGY